MHEVLIRFRFVDCGQIVECALDERLSFRDNLRLLKQILELDIQDMAIYDPQKKIFLKEDVAISEFNISSFILLYIFNQSQENL